MLKYVVRDELMKWEKDIEKPAGYPDNPPVKDCWHWTGSVTTTGLPFSSFNGRLVSARQFLFAYVYQSWDDIPTPACGCGNSRCVNPLHTIPGYRVTITPPPEDGKTNQ